MNNKKNHNPEEGIEKEKQNSFDFFFYLNIVCNLILFVLFVFLVHLFNVIFCQMQVSMLYYSIVLL